jgi:hypothetical protein
VTPAGRESDFNDEQPENAQGSISDNADPSSKLHSEREEHESKQ